MAETVLASGVPLYAIDRSTVNAGQMLESVVVPLPGDRIIVLNRPVSQARIFEGFFTTQDTMAYSSKRPFDFNAGGKGADLLRAKIFAERHGFTIEMVSSRCRFIPAEQDVCPGRISRCRHCSRRQDCLDSGGTTFSLYFPPPPAGAAP